MYEGQWLGGYQHGQGTLSIDGKVQQRGRWDRGMYVSPGSLTWQEQTQESVEWAREHVDNIRVDAIASRGGKSGNKRTHDSDKTVNSLVTKLTGMTMLEREEKARFSNHAMNGMLVSLENIVIDGPPVPSSLSTPTPTPMLTVAVPASAQCAHVPASKPEAHAPTPPEAPVSTQPEAPMSDIGRHAALCLISGVIANVPITNCSIVKSVRHAAER